MKTRMIAALLLAPLAASAGEAIPVTAKSQLRGALMMSFAKTYAVNQALLGAESAYGVACRDEKSYTSLMMIDMFLAPALSEKKTISRYLGAAGAPLPDAAAHQAATALVFQLEQAAKNLAKVMEPAERCKNFMDEKDAAADKIALAAFDARTSEETNDMTWDAARQHAGINVMRLKEFDVAEELKAARALAEKTK
ncbi:MAG: hypothetical protein PHS14_12940 [Elusimicrobia bacterium]|nr:hypothetical protein [Elusimicrobiota bacterium]